MWICVIVNSPAQKSPRHLRKWTWRGPQEAVCSRICYLPFASSWHQSPSSPLNFPICLGVLLTMPAAACNWLTKLFIKQLSKPFCFSTGYVSQDFFSSLLLSFESSPVPGGLPLSWSMMPKAGCNPVTLQVLHGLKAWTQVCHNIIHSHLYCEFSVTLASPLVSLRLDHDIASKHPRTRDVDSNASFWPSSCWNSPTSYGQTSGRFGFWFFLFLFFSFGSLEIRQI